MIIVLNGPAASGKGTLARALASHLQLPHYDFGLMFRAVALLRLRHDWTTIIELIGARRLCVSAGCILLDGLDMSAHLVQESVGLIAAQLATREEACLVDAARSLVRHESFVADGRTISQIFPDADWHFQIVVDQELAKQRRQEQGCDTVAFLDRRRLDAPRLSFAPQAIVIDTTGKTPKQSLEEILTHFSGAGRIGDCRS